jgi:hypothetical protein
MEPARASPEGADSGVDAWLFRGVAVAVAIAITPRQRRAARRAESHQNYGGIKTDTL